MIWFTTSALVALCLLASAAAAHAACAWVVWAGVLVKARLPMPEMMHFPADPSLSVTPPMALVVSEPNP